MYFYFVLLEASSVLKIQISVVFDFYYQALEQNRALFSCRSTLLYSICFTEFYRSL